MQSMIWIVTNMLLLLVLARAAKGPPNPDPWEPYLAPGIRGPPYAPPDIGPRQLPRNFFDDKPGLSYHQQLWVRRKYTDQHDTQQKQLLYEHESEAPSPKIVENVKQSIELNVRTTIADLRRKNAERKLKPSALGPQLPRTVREEYKYLWAEAEERQKELSKLRMLERKNANQAEEARKVSQASTESAERRAKDMEQLRATLEEKGRKPQRDQSPEEKAELFQLRRQLRATNSARESNLKAITRTKDTAERAATRAEGLAAQAAEIEARLEELKRRIREIQEQVGVAPTTTTAADSDVEEPNVEGTNGRNEFSRDPKPVVNNIMSLDRDDAGRLIQDAGKQFLESIRGTPSGAEQKQPGRYLPRPLAGSKPFRVLGH